MHIERDPGCPFGRPCLEAGVACPQLPQNQNPLLLAEDICTNALMANARLGKEKIGTGRGLYLLAYTNIELGVGTQDPVVSALGFARAHAFALNAAAGAIETVERARAYVAIAALPAFRERQGGDQPRTETVWTYYRNLGSSLGMFMPAIKNLGSYNIDGKDQASEVGLMAEIIIAGLRARKGHMMYPTSLREGQNEVTPYLNHDYYAIENARKVPIEVKNNKKGSYDEEEICVVSLRYVVNRIAESITGRASRGIAEHFIISLGNAMVDEAAGKKLNNGQHEILNQGSLVVRNYIETWKRKKWRHAQ